MAPRRREESGIRKKYYCDETNSAIYVKQRAKHFSTPQNELVLEANELK
jgi:hypothetical protein